MDINKEFSDWWAPELARLREWTLKNQGVSAPETFFDSYASWAKAGYIAAATPRDLLIEQLVKALKVCKISHNDCEDKWYACPKSSGGCADERQGDDCNCGADQHNAAVDSALSAAKERGFL